MEYPLLGSAVLFLTVLFLARRPLAEAFAQWTARWMEQASDPQREELAALIAREKELMRAESGSKTDGKRGD